MKEPRRELHLFFATENSTAVILYRAKSQLFRLISWKSRSNEFKLGQWIKAQVHPPGCALSPDGRHFLSLITNGMWDSASQADLTAISRALILRP